MFDFTESSLTNQTLIVVGIIFGVVSKTHNAKVKLYCRVTRTSSKKARNTPPVLYNESYLQKKNVVVVDVRANRTTLLSVAYHDVIHSPVRDEPKLVEQVGHLLCHEKI